MKNNKDEMWHFNLYYIFLEDKEKNSLSNTKAETLRLKVFEQLNDIG